MAAAGDRIDKFTLVRQLGAGGMGETWEAVRQAGHEFEQRVAIKLADPETLECAEGIEAFRREAALAASLRHPNIAAVLDVDERAGYIVCELVDGADLRAVLRAVPGGRLELPVLVHVVGQIARGLSHAHRRILRGRRSPVIHRDMSPGNAVVDYDGNIKIVDFGIAKACNGSDAAEAIKGKLAYMAPEQAMGGRMDGRVDQYALGVIAYEALSGARPNDGADDGETLACILGGKHARLSQRLPQLEPAIAEIIERMLERNPDDRFPSMDAVLDAFAPFTPPITIHRELIPLVIHARQPHTILRENGQFVSRPIEADSLLREHTPSHPLRESLPSARPAMRAADWPFAPRGREGARAARSRDEAADLSGRDALAMRGRDEGAARRARQDAAEQRSRADAAALRGREHAALLRGREDAAGPHGRASHALEPRVGSNSVAAWPVARPRRDTSSEPSHTDPARKLALATTADASERLRRAVSAAPVAARSLAVSLANTLRPAAAHSRSVRARAGARVERRPDFARRLRRWIDRLLASRAFWQGLTVLGAVLLALVTWIAMSPDLLLSLVPAHPHPAASAASSASSHASAERKAAQQGVGAERSEAQATASSQSTPVLAAAESGPPSSTTAATNSQRAARRSAASDALARGQPRSSRGEDGASAARADATEHASHGDHESSPRGDTIAAATDRLDVSDFILAAPDPTGADGASPPPPAADAASLVRGRSAESVANEPAAGEAARLETARKHTDTAENLPNKPAAEQHGGKVAAIVPRADNLRARQVE